MNCASCLGSLAHSLMKDVNIISSWERLAIIPMTYLREFKTWPCIPGKENPDESEMRQEMRRQEEGQRQVSDPHRTSHQFLAVDWGQEPRGDVDGG